MQGCCTAESIAALVFFFFVRRRLGGMCTFPCRVIRGLPDQVRGLGSTVFDWFRRWEKFQGYEVYIHTSRSICMFIPGIYFFVE